MPYRFAVKLLLALLLFALFLNLLKCNPDDFHLYKSESFSVYPNRVVQGDYVAIAESNDCIISNYPGSKKEWNLNSDLSKLPQYKSNLKLLDAVYNLSLEELELNLARDTTSNSGEKWKEVRTRDISYSVILALAITHPKVSMNSLLEKVKHGRIIQDTGTGGSWPVSSDRMVWSVAAWELYKTTGDLDWLKKAYFVIKNSTEDDLNVVWDYQKHLFKGESTFLNKREQSYPEWMEPIDIYNSYSLGTQAVHYQSLNVLIQMGKILGKDVQKYQHISEALKKSIDEKFWLPDHSYYGQFLYGRKHHLLSERSESLGESLMVLWNIADEGKQDKIIANTPLTAYGIPCFYPQSPDMPSYHNKAIWPFVQAYRNWASAKTKNTESVNIGIASLLRSTSLFLTNKESFLISNGDFNGTQINSDRQLCSVSGSLSTVFRILLGLNYNVNSLEFRPFIPREYKGKQQLYGLKYQNAMLDIVVYGFGDRINSFYIDGKQYQNAIVPNDLEGYHRVEIMMDNQLPGKSKLNLVKNITVPKTPSVTFSDNQLSWSKVEQAELYHVYQNGELLLETRDQYMSEAHINEPVELQVLAIDSLGNKSFCNEPLHLYNSKYERLVEAENYLRNSTKSFVELTKKQNRDYNFQIRATQTGKFLIDFLYANGNGAISNDNKCAVRSLWINNSFAGTLVFPQRGKNNWNDYGFSNAIEVELIKGMNPFKISFEEFNNNMNRDINSVRIDKIRLIRIN